MTTSRPLPRRAFLLGGVTFAAAVAAGCAGEDGAPDAAPPSSDDPGDAPSSSATETSGAPTSASVDELPTTEASAPADFVITGSGDADVVALTFHTNGDLGLAEQLVSTLERHDAVATSFVVGNWLASNPAWADRLREAGIELANHTWSHPGFASLTPDAMADEIGRCRETLVELTGSGGRFFRPSGTDDGTAPPSDAVLTAAGDAGYEVVLGWDVEPYDYQDPGADAIERVVRREVAAGSVVSLHFGHPGTVEALDPILTDLADRGLRTVTASELLGR